MKQVWWIFYWLSYLPFVSVEKRQCLLNRQVLNNFRFVYLLWYYFERQQIDLPGEGEAIWCSFWSCPIKIVIQTIRQRYFFAGLDFWKCSCRLETYDCLDNNTMKFSIATDIRCKETIVVLSYIFALHHDVLSNKPTCTKCCTV